MEKTKKVTAQNLPQKLSDDIVQLIISRHLKPGDKLPNEMSLSSYLKAGRSSVREAMKLLVSRNIVEIRQGSGTYVSGSGRLGISDDPLGLIFLDDSPKLISDLMEIRILLEPPVAAMAARNADEDNMRKIRRFCSDTEELIREGKNHTQADILFHQAISFGSKNVVAPRLVPIISRSIEAMVDISDEKTLEETIESNRQITKAIAAHDPVSARDSMYLHLVYYRHVFMRTDAEMGKIVEQGNHSVKLQNRKK